MVFLNEAIFSRVFRDLSKYLAGYNERMRRYAYNQSFFKNLFRWETGS